MISDRIRQPFPTTTRDVWNNDTDKYFSDENDGDDDDFPQKIGVNGNILREYEDC